MERAGLNEVSRIVRFKSCVMQQTKGRHIGVHFVNTNAANPKTMNNAFRTCISAFRVFVTTFTRIFYLFKINGIDIFLIK